MPFPLSAQVRPWGRVPDSASVGTGAPVARTMKLNADPSVAVAAAAEVNTGAALTVSTNDWVVVPLAFLAVNVTGYVPPLAAVGVPDRLAVPSPLLPNETPASSAPLSVTLVV